MTPSRPPRGSRKHILDLTAQPDFPAQMQALLAEVPVAMGTSDRWMPRGHAHPQEARLETFGPSWLPGHPAWAALSAWWLAHRRGANTPNWDLAIGCRIEDKPGLVLVEAKANEPEMSASGKPLARTASAASRDNHRRIGEALEEATAALRVHDPAVHLSRDSHYQLANRLAFTWKLGTLGIPTVLVYLGFTHDPGIADAGTPFHTHADWSRGFQHYASTTVPMHLFETRLATGAAPIWWLSRSLPALEPSPPRGG